MGKARKVSIGGRSICGHIRDLTSACRFLLALRLNAWKCWEATYDPQCYYIPICPPHRTGGLFLWPRDWKLSLQQPASNEATSHQDDTRSHTTLWLVQRSWGNVTNLLTRLGDKLTCCSMCTFILQMLLRLYSTHRCIALHAYAETCSHGIWDRHMHGGSCSVSGQYQLRRRTSWSFTAVTTWTFCRQWPQKIR